jgi:hypothetical protein
MGLWWKFKGAKVPYRKMGYFKAIGLNIGWAGK